MPPTFPGITRGTKHTIRNVKILGGGRKQHREDKFKNPYRHCKPEFSLLNRPALAQVSVRLPGLAALSTKEKCIHTNANRERGLPEEKIIIE